jgi:lipocalin
MEDRPTATRDELLNAIAFLKDNISSGIVLEFIASKYGAKINPVKTIYENAVSLVDYLTQYTSYDYSAIIKNRPPPRDIKVALQPDLQLESYQGLWYNAGRIPQPFDRSTPWETAQYRISDKKTSSGLPIVTVLNTAYNEDGSIRGKIQGTAEVMDAQQKSALYVSFPTGQPRPQNPSANYLIHATDYTTFAVVGSYDGSNLYFLVRQRPIGKELYAKMLDYAQRLGYDTSLVVPDYGAVG